METFGLFFGGIFFAVLIIGLLWFAHVRHLRRGTTVGVVVGIVSVFGLGAYPLIRFMALDEPLQIAARAGDNRKVHDLLCRGADPNGPGEFGTPLSGAVEAGSVASVRELITAGADVNLPASDGKSVLRHAIAGKNSQIVKLLTEAGAKH